MDICLARRTMKSKFPIIFRHFLFSIIHHFFLFKLKKKTRVNLKKKRSEYLGKVISDNVKPESHFQTQKQEKSNFAENYTAKTTKNIFFVNIPSAPSIF